MANGIAASGQHGEQQQQQNGQQPPAGEEQQETGALISWRSDAVQLPEQVLLQEALPASPTGSAKAAAAANQDAGASLTARTRGR